MITEDPRHIEPQILRDHGRGTVDAGTRADGWWGGVGGAGGGAGGGVAGGRCGGGRGGGGGGGVGGGGGGGAGEEVTVRSWVGVTARALRLRLGRWRHR